LKGILVIGSENDDDADADAIKIVNTIMTKQICCILIKLDLNLILNFSV
jgi:hypothetical protein